MSKRQQEIEEAKSRTGTAKKTARRLRITGPKKSAGTPARESIAAPSVERCPRCRRLMQHQQHGERDWFLCFKDGAIVTYGQVRIRMVNVDFDDVVAEAAALFKGGG